MKTIGNIILLAAKFIGISTKDMDIVIDHHYVSKIYSCGSTVSGHVEINPRTDTSFSSIHISLLGKVSIRREDVYVLAHSTHLFLQLHMPVHESALPTPRLFKVGNFYSIPFQFVIPQNLPDGSCHHSVESSMIRRRHLQLPSTLTGWDKDDLSPGLMEVRYCVRAMVLENDTSGTKEPLLKMEAERFISLIATSTEDLPITIGKKDLNFTLEKTEHIHKSKRTGSSGYITAKSAQPEAVRLSQDGHEASGSSTQIQFTFTPSLDAMPPPKITVKSVKILAHTWGFLRPKPVLPDLGSGPVCFAIAGCHESRLPLRVKSTTSLSQQGNLESLGKPQQTPISSDPDEKPGPRWSRKKSQVSQEPRRTKQEYSQPALSLFDI
ncbi:hypothetical protein LZ30DRAFT_801419 [Colletotrichum cereale]|nr:hypothetical protein LZ30DRAFT_801419 [Colletotrichum cereale]